MLVHFNRCANDCVREIVNNLVRLDPLPVRFTYSNSPAAVPAVLAVLGVLGGS
jgi:hypothetical protein